MTEQNNSGYEDRVTADKVEFVKLSDEERAMDYKDRRKKYYESMKASVALVQKRLEEHPEEPDEIDKELQAKEVQALEEMRIKK